MIRKVLISILLIVSLLDVRAQLVVSTGALTPTQYVQDVLVGSGVAISNVTFSGNSNQIGEFDASATNPNIGLTNGVIMATGDVNVALGPNNTGSDQLGGGNFGAGDPDLDVLEGTGVGTNDAAILEFDFIPTGDTVKFNFVFASEEYPEFVNSINDVFGFFLSGPGVAGTFTGGAANIALVPGTTTPISINTVNSGSNPSYYVDNTINTNNETIEFDGHTVVMTAISQVQCGELYHIKIAIADASDTAYDSAVFLEAGSFSSNTVTLSSNIDVANGDSVLYEGCGTAFIDFVRDDDTDTSTYYYNIYGAATGADYVVSDDSIVFLPGQDTVTMSFNAISDGLVEPIEQVNIEMIQTICGIQDTSIITFYISDYPTFNVIASDTSVSCLSDSVPIWIEPIVGDVNVVWSTGATSDTIWVSPLSTSVYHVTVSDTCGIYSITDSSIVTFISPSPIIINAPDSVVKYCPQDSVLLYAQASGGAGTGGFNYDWHPIGSTKDSVFVNPNVTTTYTITVTDVCNNSEFDSVKVIVPGYIPVSANILTDDTTICLGLNVPINAQVNGGIGTYYSWNNGLPSSTSVSVSPATNTTYVLTAQDSCGGIAKDSIIVTVDVSGISTNLPDLSVDCYNETTILDANVTNNIGPVTYDWSTGEITPSIQVSPLVTSTYWVTVEDLCKTIVDTVTITVPVFDSLDVTIDGTIVLDCPGDLAMLSANIVGGNPPSMFINWNDGINTYVGNDIPVYPQMTTVYNLSVTDTCAFMQDTASLTVTVPSFAPLTAQVTNDTTICRGEGVSLEVTAQGGAGGYVYDWKGYGTSDSIYVEAYSETTYNVVVIDQCNNYVTESVTIDVMHPTAHFNYEYVSDYTVEFEDSSYTDIIYHQWTFDYGDTSNELDPIYTYLTPGEHEVTLFVRDINGCTDQITRTIIPTFHIYAPNAFTPNLDGTNDLFLVKGMGIEEFELFIYNRWGELLYHTDDIDQGWDGTYKGSLVQNGSYVFLVKAKNYFDAQIEQRGVVNVLR